MHSLLTHITSTIAGSVALLIAAAHHLPAQTKVTSKAQTSERITSLLRQLKTGEVGEPAADALRAMGAPVVPHLVRRLRAVDTSKPRSGFAVLRLLWRMTTVAGSAAPTILLHMGRVQEEDVNHVLLLLSEVAPFADKDFRESLLEHELLQWPPRVLESADHRARVKPTWIAFRYRLRQRLRVDVRASTETLIAELRADRVYRRSVATDALAARGKANDAVISILAKAVEDQHGAQHRERKVVVSGVRLALVDQFFFRAQEALMVLAPRDPRTAAVYLWRLREHRSPAMRAKAARDLARIEGSAPAIVPGLRDAVGSQHAVVLVAVIEALDELRDWRSSDEARLKAWSKDERAEVARAAKQSLAGMRNRGRK